jgi:GntR family transcriptional repressor for pyruvate dehydrogenase complex
MRPSPEAHSQPRPRDMTAIERVSVAEQVARNLLGRIRSRSILPGQQLPTERDLAATLRVSRPSVREALRGLQTLGVLTARQGGGVFVTALNAAELLQPLHMLIALTEENFQALYESRVLIEGAIGRLLAEKIEEATIAKLRRMLQIQAELIDDPIAFRASDTEFHRTLGSAIANPFLERISEALFVLGMEYREIEHETPDVLARSVRDHRAIVAALATRDSAKSEAAMVRHMQTVHETTKAAKVDWSNHD